MALVNNYETGILFLKVPQAVRNAGLRPEAREREREGELEMRDTRACSEHPRTSLLSTCAERILATVADVQDPVRVFVSG